MPIIGSGALALLATACVALLLVIFQPKAKRKAGRFVPILTLVLISLLMLQISATFEASYGQSALVLRGLVAVIVTILMGWAILRLIIKKFGSTQGLLLAAGYILAMILVWTVAVQSAGRFKFLSWEKHIWGAVEGVMIFLASGIVIAVVVGMIVLFAVRLAKRLLKKAEAPPKPKADDAAH